MFVQLSSPLVDGLFSEKSTVYIGTDGSDHASFFWVLSIPRSYSPEYTDVAEIPDRLKFCLDFIQDWDPRL